LGAASERRRNVITGQPAAAKATASPPREHLLTISIENMYFIGRTMTMSEAGS